MSCWIELELLLVKHFPFGKVLSAPDLCTELKNLYRNYEESTGALHYDAKYMMHFTVTIIQTDHRNFASIFHSF